MTLGITPFNEVKVPSVNRANGDWGIHLIDTSDDEICDFLATLDADLFFNVKSHDYFKKKRIVEAGLINLIYKILTYIDKSSVAHKSV